MKTLRVMVVSVLVIGVLPAASAQQKLNLGDNAALRYWSAFAQMQDLALTDDQAKELKLVLDGTAPYVDLKYKELVEKNRWALETMARGTNLSNCDWGLDYRLGPETPVDYVRKALVLGRLNVLYVLHLAINGDKDGAARALAAGIRFSHDVANGGTLFASMIAKQILADHLRLVANLNHLQTISPAQRSTLQQAVAQLGAEGLDWRANVKRELGILRDHDPQFPHGLSPEATTALSRIAPAYVGVLDKPATLAELQQMIAGAPPSLREIIPNPKSVVDAKQELTDKIQQTRSLLR